MICKIVDDAFEVFIGGLILLLFLLVVVMIFSVLNTPPAILENGVVCKSVIKGHCGYTLTQCSDGKLRACVKEVETRKETQ